MYKLCYNKHDNKHDYTNAYYRLYVKYTLLKEHTGEILVIMTKYVLVI